MVSSFDKAKDQGLVDLHYFDNVTKPWVVRSKLDPSLTGEIRKALLAIKDKKALDAIGEKITGFAEAKDEMYESVRFGMRKSDEFDPTGARASVKGGGERKELGSEK